MAHLANARIERFKRIEDATLPFAPLNVLVGANNAGKSSIIQALHFGVGVLQTLNLIGSRKGAATLNPSQLIYSPTESVYPLGGGGRLLEDESQSIKISFGLDNGEQCSVAIRKGRNRNIKVQVEGVDTAKKISDLSKPFTIFSPGLAGIAKNEQFVSDGVLLRTLARGDANLVLRNILLRLWGKPEWKLFLDDLRQVFPDADIKVSWSEDTDEYIDVSYIQHDRSVPIELAGTGALQAMQILSYIHRFTPNLVVLDEPDSHLHPNNQRLLCDLLRSISTDRGTQVVLTTHSRHVVDALSGTVQFLWVRNSTVEAVSIDDQIGVLLDIGALDIRERVNSQNADAIVLTEDTNTLGLETLLYSNGFSKDRTLVLPYHGVTSVKNLRPLLNMINSTNRSAVVIVHRDRDFLLDDEVKSWQIAIRNLKAEPFVTHGTDVESHLASPDHLASLNAGVSADDFRQQIEDAAKSINDDLVAAYVNGRISIERENGNSGRINHGKLAASAPKELENNPQRLRHGKLLLRAIRGSFQDLNKKNLVVYRESEFLQHAPLKELLQRVQSRPKRATNNPMDRSGGAAAS